MSVHSTVLGAFVSLIDALELTLGSTRLTVADATKTPEAREGLDSQPLVKVSCHRQGGQRGRWDTGGPVASPGVGRVKVTYLVSVSIELAGDRDPRTNLGTVTGWRQSIFRACAEPSQFSAFGFGTSQFYDVEHEDEAPFDAEAARDNWDSSPMTFRVVMIEPSTGE